MRTRTYTNTMYTMWEHKVCLSAYDRKVYHIFHLAQQNVWGYVPLAQIRPLPNVRGSHSGLCSHTRTHSPQPGQTVKPNPSKVGATHHCNSVRVLRYLYPKLSCRCRTMLRYSCFINTDIQFCHSMNIKSHQIVPLRAQEFEITIFVAILTRHSTSSAF